MENNGLFFYLEHRFYGDSQPFPTLATENLRYLTSRHALADLAVFLTYANDKIVQEHGGEKRKIIVVGGSYPGALSAWFREKYPHIADASWASSAVVNAIDNYDLFDYQIWNSTLRSSSYCTGTIQNLTLVYDRLVEQGNKAELNKIKSAFGAESLNDGDFAFYLADVFVGEVQYGNRTVLCEFLESLAGVNIMEQYGRIAERYGDPGDAETYDRKYLKKDQIIISDASRAWLYQYCTEFGYFQMPYQNLNMRSKLLGREYWDGLCQDVFGAEIRTLNRETNIHYGSIEGRESNTFLVNGGEDPWQWSGVLESTQSLNQIARLLQCENCGHCVELYNEKDEDSQELKETRKQIKEWVNMILYGHLKY
mmetsp:Transcript_7831/g.6927  ORF Transcript_7831/g.6927 Transcript_7831/m.6927 type:complete len:367 (+) Transcript_7831:304-1404(+)